MGDFVGGRSPQTKLWAIKSEALKYRVGGQINYYFLHKAFNFWTKQQNIFKT